MCFVYSTFYSVWFLTSSVFPTEGLLIYPVEKKRKNDLPHLCFSCTGQENQWMGFLIHLTYLSYLQAFFLLFLESLSILNHYHIQTVLARLKINFFPEKKWPVFTNSLPETSKLSYEFTGWDYASLFSASFQQCCSECFPMAGLGLFPHVWLGVLFICCLVRFF